MYSDKISSSLAKTILISAIYSRCVYIEGEIRDWVYTKKFPTFKLNAKVANSFELYNSNYLMV